ncbi:hypothetical protein ACN28S_66160 [Cystobacter fuscus]
MSNRAALLLCVILSAGCTAPGPGSEQEQSALTRQFIRVTKEVPAFGGVTREDGGWVVSLLDPGQRESAEARLRDIFQEDAAHITVRVRAPRGSASEQTKEAARDVLGVPGVGTLDFDETTGYLRVGLVEVEASSPPRPGSTRSASRATRSCSKRRHRSSRGEVLTASEAGVRGSTGPAMIGPMTPVRSFRHRSWLQARQLGPALLALTLGPWCLEAAAAPALASLFAQTPSPSELLTRACAALEAGDLDGAAGHILTLRQTLPESPEPRLLESLLALRRTRPSLGWREAYLQAWNGIGRPDFRDSFLLPEKQQESEPFTATPLEKLWKKELSAEQRFLLALAMQPVDAEQARALITYLPKLTTLELLNPIAEDLKSDRLPAPLRDQLRAALRARLAALSTEHPESMQLRALLLLEGTSERAPFTAREIQELEALSLLPDWRQSDFLSLYQSTLRQFEAIGVSPADNHAYTVSVLALAGTAPWLLQTRAEASWDTLTPTERQRLGEAMWRIGSRLSEESSILERFVGLNLMKKAATALGDEERLRQATEWRAEAQAIYTARQAADPHLWPLPSLRTEMFESAVRDEVALMRAFRVPEAGMR